MSKKDTQLNKQKKQLLQLYRQALQDGVAIQDVDKKINYYLKQDQASRKGEQDLDEQIKLNFWRRLPKTIRVGATIFPLALIVFGLVLALSAMWPLIEYYLPWNKRDELALLSPIPHSQVLLSTPLLSAQAQNDIESEVVSNLFYRLVRIT